MPRSKPTSATPRQLGAITGTIDSIVAGGVPLEDGDANKIFLYLSDLDVTANDNNNIDAGDGSFDGRTRMGMGTLGDDGEYDYPMNGSWSGQFYNGTPNDPDTDADNVNESHVPPGSVAGTFGVTGTTGEGDDAMTRSYLGAFGAHEKTE